jgi:hypothetical protein
MITKTLCRGCLPLKDRKSLSLVTSNLCPLSGTTCQMMKVGVTQNRKKRGKIKETAISKEESPLKRS